MDFTACIVAAGRGERAGDGPPKQLRPLAGRPVLAWSLERFDRHARCEAIVIAVSDAVRADVERLAQSLHTPVTLVEGGAQRTDSVRACLAAAHSEAVLIHDAARPLLSEALIDRLLDALAHTPGAAPALPVADALVREGAGGAEPVDRSALRRMQTPQAFLTRNVKTAFQHIGEKAFPDEVSLAHAAGLAVTLVEGEERNFKLTWPADFERAEQWLGRRGATLPVTGFGYDVHRLAPGDGVTLCGVFIPCALALVGHSDADAGLHALTDAILGAAGAGDIGQHFPPSDPQWKGADSAAFLTHALKLARARGVTPVNADVTLICERPKIGPHREAMAERIAALLDLPLSRVNVKATTTEGLGFTGRGEGLAAQAVFTGLAAGEG